MQKFDDLRVLARGEFSARSAADLMVVRQDERPRALGWIFRTGNDQFDARRWNQRPIGIFPDLEQAVCAIGEIGPSRGVR
jgi:hypothetical protein